MFDRRHRLAHGVRRERVGEISHGAHGTTCRAGSVWVVIKRRTVVALTPRRCAASSSVRCLARLIAIKRGDGMIVTCRADAAFGPRIARTRSAAQAD